MAPCGLHIASSRLPDTERRIRRIHYPDKSVIYHRCKARLPNAACANYPKSSAPITTDATERKHRHSAFDGTFPPVRSLVDEQLHPIQRCIREGSSIRLSICLYIILSALADLSGQFVAIRARGVFRGEHGVRRLGDTLTRHPPTRADNHRSRGLYRPVSHVPIFCESFTGNSEHPSLSATSKAFRTSSPSKCRQRERERASESRIISPKTCFSLIPSRATGGGASYSSPRHGVFLSAPLLPQSIFTLKPMTPSSVAPDPGALIDLYALSIASNMSASDREVSPLSPIHQIPPSAHAAYAARRDIM